MKKLTLLSIYVLGIGIALQVPVASAQTGASGTTTKPPATQSTTPGAAAAKPPAAKPPAVGQVTLKDEKAKTSYALGMNLAHTVKMQPLDLDSAAFIQGIKDVLAGGKTLMTEEEMAAALTVLQTEMNAKAADEAKKLGETNKVEGAAFLAANKTKEGVVTLPSGLQYKIITAGTGPKPTAADTVVCNYRGTLLNGTEFDSSYKRGQPTPFPVGRVIKGWTEALQLMPVGSKWQLFIPDDMAYSNHPPPGSGIGPNATLIFDVELISIQGK
ncbi:MAG TPA: FKBP-type peptidyl-prolyl cis-trans isomerase [Candidatus Acidoferrales bacterium]|jgi:FKBP-type peptidyl-prolyl cis-trans isomerase FklB